MLSDPSTSSERQALLQRPFPQKSLLRSCIERCLFVLSDGQLLFMLVGLFLLSLASQSELRTWLHGLIVTLKADVLFAFLLVASIMSVVICIMNIGLDSCNDIFGNVVWLMLNLVIAWYSMLKICDIHRLEMQCWSPKHCRHHPNDANRPNLEGLDNVVQCWSWLPQGLVMAVVGTLWRPVWFFVYVLPWGVFGKGPLSTMPWWQWRTIIVGCVLWPFLIVLSTVAAAIEEDRRRVVVLSFIFTLLFSAIPFYLTSEPVMAFWSFLARPWGKLFAWTFWPAEKQLKRSAELSLTAEEWGAFMVMVWWLARMLYVMASMRLEEFNARRRVEEGLRFALEHPFHADLEAGFGTQALGAAVSADSAQARSPTSRNQDLLGGQAGAVAVKSLEEKRQQLIGLMRDHPPVLPRRLMLRVRRTHLLEDSWKMMIEKPVLELLAPNMIVSYGDELGSDAGGLTRDWFTAVATELADGSDNIDGTSLFAAAPDGTLIPRPIRPDDDQAKFKHLLAAGRFLALAVYREQSLPVAFGLITCKHILGVAVGLDDVRQLDPEFYRGRVEAVLREGGLARLNAALGEPLVFMSAASHVHPVPEPLKNGGAEIQVTDENKVEYVKLLCEAYLCSGVRREIQSLLQGFYALLPHAVLRQCRITPRELSVMISGVATLDPIDWCSNTSAGDTRVHAWFWEVVREMDAEQRCMLLHFATGSSRLPPGGFAYLKPQFVVVVSPGQGDRLPVAHTCANQLVLQEYDSKAQLKEKLLLAVATESFELV